jgi:manganese/zinc/iron transport system ATP- binding protein
MSPNTHLSLAFDGPPHLEPKGVVSALSVRGLTVAYGPNPAVFSVDADFPQAALSAIVGPNGAGKSTFLKAALGLIPAMSGQVKVFDAPVGDMRPKIAYVPQRASVDWDFPATVIDVVMMGQFRELGLWRRPRADDYALAQDALARVGMQNFASRQIGQLSGGQQQRVFLARALAQQADLYVLDEPFAGVDAATERTIIEVLKSLKAQGKSVIAVHHDLATVQAYFDHLFLINVRCMAQGPVATTFTPDHLAQTYGGRLAATHLDELTLAQGAG